MDAAPPRIYTFAECLSIIETLHPLDVIASMASGFVAFSKGEVSNAPIQTLGQPPLANFVGHPDAQACIKSAYVNGGEFFVSKVACGGGGLNSGLVLVFSQRTFAPSAIFLDNGYLTELRTAAAGALAVQQFGPTPLNAITVIGCGVQARWQLRLLAAVTPCRRVKAWARRPEQVQALIAELQPLGWCIEAASSIEAACMGAGLVISVTCAREPLLKRSYFTSAGDVLINAMGADAPGKQELEPELVVSAAMLVVDSRAQCIERGELQHAVGAGLLAKKEIFEIGELLSGSRGASSKTAVRPPGVIVFDSTGVAIQDAKIAELALTAASRGQLTCKL